MSIKILKGTDSIPVEHPVFMIFGQPGICKSSLGYSAKEPLVLDFDRGAHRAANRRDTLLIETWGDIAELMKSPDVLAPYSTIVVDTVGRCLDFIIADIANTEPKKVQGGNPTQQGWGTLKNRFRNWMSQLRLLGKDVMLIAHDKEDKDGDLRIVRPDIVGGSYSEVMKIADFVGYVYMAGKDRILDFNPTDRWSGKNPGQWKPFTVPPVSKAQDFIAKLYDDGRSVLGALSEESANVIRLVDDWRAAIDAYNTAEDCTKAVAQINKVNLPLVQVQAKRLLQDRAKVLGLEWKTDKFVGKAVEQVPA